MVSCGGGVIPSPRSEAEPRKVGRDLQSDVGGMERKIPPVLESSHSKKNC